MDPTHLHLLLNHVPTVGFGIGVAMFVLGLAGRSSDLKQASLVIFVGVALISIPTYVTGNAAQVHLQERGEVSDGTTEGMVTPSAAWCRKSIASASWRARTAASRSRSTRARTRRILIAAA